jgi:hypothetical protein
MELRTTFSIEPSDEKITYNDKVMFIGSCFASNMGSQMELGHLPVMINPAGTVFNPVSVSNTLDIITGKKEFFSDDLHFHDGNWLSFFHYTDFSSDDRSKVLQKINSRTAKASEFLSKAKFLFITFGTARVYFLRKSGMVVSNCHKIPSSQFESKLLSVEEIVSVWTQQLEKLNNLYPELKVIFTVSPVRHWKDGAHGNQVSKSVLFLVIEQLLAHKSAPKYFPAYELLMDDLRDYRFYNDDMLHPSSQAVSYIWDAFAECYLEKDTLIIWKEAVKISKAFNHRLGTDSINKLSLFANKILKQISDLKDKAPDIDLSMEEEYFLKMRKTE